MANPDMMQHDFAQCSEGACVRTQPSGVAPPVVTAAMVERALAAINKGHHGLVGELQSVVPTTRERAMRVVLEAALGEGSADKHAR